MSAASLFPKQVSVFHFDTMPSDDVIEHHLNTKRFTELGKMDLACTGFTPVLMQDFLLTTNESWKACQKNTKRILPKSVINDELEKRISKMNKKPSKKELSEMKEGVLNELIPKALSQSSYLNIFCHKSSGLLFVETGSSKVAEKVADELKRIDNNSTKISTIKTEISPTDWMTSLVLKNEDDGNFMVADSCSLKQDNKTIKVKNKSIEDETILAHIHEGFVVNELRLHWKGCLSFVLTEKLVIKKIEFHDNLLDEFGLQEEEYDEVYFIKKMQTFIINTLSELVLDLLNNHLGGVKQ